MNTAVVVFVKEMRENLRDRRSLARSLIFGPLLGPFVFVLMLQIAVGQHTEQAEGPLSLPVIGAANAPHLIAALQAQGLDPQPAPTDPIQQVRNGEVDAVLVIPKDFDQAWRAGQTASVRVVYDSSHRSASTPVDRLETMVQQYAATQGHMRLLARGISPSVARPVTVDRRDQATPAARAVILFAMMPYFFFLAIFISSMYLAIDLTAGERERQSLEPLFANPVARRMILLGKLGTIGVFSLLGLMVSLLAFKIATAWMPMESLDITLTIGAAFIAVALLTMIPLIAVLAVLQTLVAGFARSFREAQTYLSVLMILPMFASLLTAFMDTGQALWQYAIPLFGQQIVILDMLRGTMPSAIAIAVTLVCTTTTALLLYLVTARTYQMERLAISG